MSKVEGVMIVSLCDDDDKCQIILQQAIDILLELWSHCFNKNSRKPVVVKKNMVNTSNLPWCSGYQPQIALQDLNNHIICLWCWLLVDFCQCQSPWHMWWNLLLQYKSIFLCPSMVHVSLIPSLFDPSVDAPLSGSWRFSLPKYHDHRHRCQSMHHRRPPPGVLRPPSLRLSSWACSRGCDDSDEDQ